MKKVITYGTYDLFHYGHRRLLERAKELGDYLIVGVTADNFDKKRGKINVEQSLMKRIEAVRETGLADKIIVEEYEGQKIDDIKKYDVDIFTLGSDWVGKYDYLKEYCEVVYLDRTKGVSSSELRSNGNQLELGLIGQGPILNKFYEESKYVNGLKITYVSHDDNLKSHWDDIDAVFIASHPDKHYKHVKSALNHGKHVLCESPIALKKDECEELFKLAEEKNLVLMEAIKTAYATAYHRLLLKLKAGIIGEIVSIDATCTSLREIKEDSWSSLTYWGPTALLPIFQIFGVDYKNLTINSRLASKREKFDVFTKMDILYPNSVASIKIGNGVKSEGDLIVSGTKGYVYIPSPWWKTDYFEIRYENMNENKKNFYQLDGEGIRYEFVIFKKSVELGKSIGQIEPKVSIAISQVMEDFENGKFNKI